MPRLVLDALDQRLLEVGNLGGPRRFLPGEVRASGRLLLPDGSILSVATPLTGEEYPQLYALEDAILARVLEQLREHKALVIP